MSLNILNRTALNALKINLLIDKYTHHTHKQLLVVYWGVRGGGGSTPNNSASDYIITNN